MKQQLSQASLFWGLGHTVRAQCGKIRSFPLLEADNWCDEFHPGGHRDMWYETPRSPLLMTSAGSQKTEDLGGAAQHLEGLIIKKAL